MAQMIDIAEVEAHMIEFRASMEKQINDPELGMVYRAQLAVLPELTIWRAKEMNRGGSPNDIMNAIVAVVAGVIAGEVMSAAGDKDEALGVINRTLRAIAEEAVAMLAQQRPITNKRFDFKDIGTA